MNTDTKAIHDEAGHLADAARDMINATAEVAHDAGEEIRHQLDAAMDRGREAYGRARETAVEGARSTDELLHEQPYKFLAVAVGVGVLFGLLLARR